MNKPDFLCIGAQKAGTSWLQNMLQQHPDIFFGPFKEYQFFNSLFVPQHRKWTSTHVQNSISRVIKHHADSSRVDFEYLQRLCKIANADYLFTHDWYEYIYSSRNAKLSLKGDITPEYSTLPIEGVRHVKEYLVCPKIIYIIRDPVSRALSQIRMNVERGQSFNSESDKITWDVINRGDYKSYVPRWDKVFNEDVMYIPYQEISQNPHQVLKNIENHIGLTPYDYRGLNKKIHVTKKVETSPELKALLKERLAPQYEFLLSRFGEEFTSRL